MESMSISELITSLKVDSEPSQYDAVAEVLVSRDERQKQIIETLNQHIASWANEESLAPPEMGAEQIYRNTLLKDTVKCYMEENEQLKKENHILKLQNETLCKDIEHKIAEAEKKMNALRNDVVRAQQKDADRQISTPKLRRSLIFRDIVHTSAARRTTTKENDEGILGQVLEIIDSDDECIVPNKGNQSANTSTEKRVERKRASSFMDLARDDETTKDSDITGRRKTRTENSTNLGGLHISSRQSLNDSVALVKCQMVNVNAQESGFPLIKSAQDELSQSVYSSSSNSQKTKIRSRYGSSGRKGKLWNFEGEMVADLTYNDHLCVEAVCALDKHRSSVEESLKSTSQDTNGPRLILLRKATSLAEFLTDGDPERRLKRSVAELRNCGHATITEFREIAVGFSKELFELYLKDEDLFEWGMEYSWE